MKKKTKKADRKKTKKIGLRNEHQTVLPDDLDRFEFHRDAVALMPEPGDPKPGVAIMTTGEKFKVFERSCTCSVSRSKTCPHILKLTARLSSDSR